MGEVAVTALGKAYGSTVVLAGVDLAVADGEVVVLLGPSGCGKTTLLRLIGGLEVADAGTVSIDGRIVAGPGVHVPPDRRRVGFVFQDGALFPHLDVAANVGFGLDRPERRSGSRIDEALSMVGLSGFEDRDPDQLSGGQRQRVALARALAPRPTVLLADEPFSNLDAELRERLRREVVSVLEEVGTTTIFVTHDRAEAFALADRIAVMRDGRLLQVGRPAELVDRPADRWVAGFVADADLVRGDSDGRVARTVLGPVPLFAGSPVGAVDVVVRPEQLELVPASPDAGPDGAAWVGGSVAAVELAGSTTVTAVRLDDAASPPVVVRVRSLGLSGRVPGERVGVLWAGGETTAFAVGG